MTVAFNNAVLYSDSIPGEYYNLLFVEQGKLFDVREILVTNRRAGEIERIYHELYNLMFRYHIDALWIHPDTQLSLWVLRSDFENIEQGVKWFSPEKKQGEHPFSLRFMNKYLYFPAYGDIVRKHTDRENWDMSTPEILLHSVNYLQQCTDTPFFFSCGNSSLRLLRSFNQEGIVHPFHPGTNSLWAQVYHKMLVRPMWRYQRREGGAGLADYMLDTWYIHCIDKNAQYLGATVNLKLGNGGYTEIIADKELQPFMFKDQIGFWEYELTNVGKSMFNGYTCYCPLSKKRSWASTQLLTFARQAGLEFTIKRGMIWEKSCGYPLNEWAKRLWNAQQLLKDREQYPDRVAAQNARDTAKKYYLDTIGRFCEEYSKEYYHKDWNMSIVHKAIANQGHSLLTRQKSVEGRILAVTNDEIYLVSPHKDVREDFSDFLVREHELSGYRHNGTCQLTPEIRAAFETEKNVSHIAMAIQKEMKGLSHE